MTIPSTATVFDTFHRTVASGWGNADSGDVWQLAGSGGTLLTTDWSVANPVGAQSVPAVVSYRLSYLPSILQADLDMSATGSVTFTGGVTGGQLEMLGLAFRAQSQISYYLARIEIAAGGSMTLRLIAPDGSTTVASAAGIVSGLTYTSGKSLSIRVRAVGPRIKIRVWDPAGAEPSTWDISVFDTSTLAAGYVLLRSGVGAGNSNTKPVVFNLTQFWLSPPVVLTTSTGQPFLRALLGSHAAIASEAAFGADLSADPDTWAWTDLGSDPRHDPGIPVTVGRGDNISQAGSGSFTSTWNNQAGNYTPNNPTATHNVGLNTPIRELMTLDGSTWTVRFQGYLDSANPVTDQSARVKGVAAAAFGMLSRLGGKTKPLKSPLYRAISGSAPYAYWPMEDGSGSVKMASLVRGIAPLTITGAVALGAAAGPGTAASVDFTGGGSARTSLIAPASITSWRMTFAFQATAAATFVPMGWTTSTGVPWGVEIGVNASGGLVTVGAINAGSTVTWDSGLLPAFQVGTWHSVSISAAQNGADVDMTISVDGGGSLIPSAFTAMTLGFITVPTLNPTSGSGVGFTSTSSAFLMAHLVFWTSSSLNLYNPTIGWLGETVVARLIRLCLEEGIALDVSGTSTVTMGPQAIDAILNLLRDCEAADHGLLYSGLGPGLGYQCRSARYNATAALTLDMGANPPQVTTFGPVFDKQAVKNLITVTRKNGGSRTAEQVDGPVGTDAIGVQDVGPTINVDSDDVLDGHAGWLLSLGTLAGFRFPGVGLNMRGIASLAATVLGVRVGARITIHRPASKAVDLPPDDIDLIVEGWTETTSASTWFLALNCSPYSPNAIATVNDTAGRIDSGDSVIHLDATPTATTISVTGTLPWVTTAANPGDFPFDIRITGERMTVTGITGATPPQTFAVIRSVNGVVKAHLAANNEPVRVQTPLVIGL